MLLSPAGNTASTYIHFCFFFSPFSLPEKLRLNGYNGKTFKAAALGCCSVFRLEMNEGIKSQVIIAPCCSQIIEIICVWGHKGWAKWPFFCLFSWKPIKNVIKKAAQQGSPAVDKQLSASEQVSAKRQQLLVHSKWKRGEILGRSRVLLFCIQHYCVLLEKRRKRAKLRRAEKAAVYSFLSGRPGYVWFSSQRWFIFTAGAWLSCTGKQRMEAESDVKVKKFIVIIFPPAEWRMSCKMIHNPWIFSHFLMSSPQTWMYLREICVIDQQNICVVYVIILKIKKKSGACFCIKHRSSVWRGLLFDHTKDASDNHFNRNTSIGNITTL